MVSINSDSSSEKTKKESIDNELLEATGYDDYSL